MGTGGIIIVLLCFGGPLLPPLVGTIVGTVHDAVTMRRLRERRANSEQVGVPRSRPDVARA